MRCEALAEGGQRLSRCHVVWQVLPRPWSDNRETPVGDGPTAVNTTGFVGVIASTILLLNNSLGVVTLLYVDDD